MTLAAGVEGQLLGGGGGACRDPSRHCVRLAPSITAASQVFGAANEWAPRHTLHRPHATPVTARRTAKGKGRGGKGRRPRRRGGTGEGGGSCLGTVNTSASSPSTRRWKMCLYQVQTRIVSEWKKRSRVVEEPPSGRVDGAVKGTRGIMVHRRSF